ncbi:uncharacterized protein LOC115926371 [Strongylocentrotus purpuratus]|uniref:Uncharacterized protein n=1 Tax=Strongylocentrotus purpuratus TaxID=7668 RepID=A0A7M7P8T3_STRPU|nr:uncharacterized protein LOC115926371 [Strongylocentrotus purpuratus]
MERYNLLTRVFHRLREESYTHSRNKAVGFVHCRGHNKATGFLFSYYHNKAVGFVHSRGHNKATGSLFSHDHNKADSIVVHCRGHNRATDFFHCRGYNAAVISLNNPANNGATSSFHIGPDESASDAGHNFQHWIHEERHHTYRFLSGKSRGPRHPIIFFDPLLVQLYQVS